MAVGILRKILADQGISDVAVSSAGTGTLDGYPATTDAVEVARRHDIDIRHHYSTRMTEKIFREADLVFALAEEHYDHMKKMADADKKLYMVKAFPEPNRSDPAHSVLDPIGGTQEEYQRTFNEIAREIRRALPEIIRRVNHR